MKINELEVAPQPVEWPTNLAWRLPLKRFKNVEPLTDIRRGKLFAMPFKNWVGTYWNLLGKDVKKLRYMQTQVVEIPVSLDLIFVNPAYRSEGIATELLLKITQLADKHKIYIHLEAIPDDESEISAATLTKFYKKVGFSKTRQSSFMERKPKIG